jgi:hypothetical protein
MESVVILLLLYLEFSNNDNGDASYQLNPFTASCENAMSLSVPGVPAPCEKFPHSSQINFE